MPPHYAYAQSMGWNTHCQIIQGNVNDIAANMQQQLGLYQSLMPMWLQVLDSLSNVVEPGSKGANPPTINWSTFGSDEVPSSFLCVLQFPSGWTIGNLTPPWTAVDPSYNSTFPVSSTPSGSEAPGTQMLSNYTGDYIGFQSGLPDGDLSSVLWNLTPQSDGSFTFQNVATGNSLQAATDSSPCLPVPILGTGGGKIWICPLYPAPDPVLSNWQDRILIYMTAPALDSAPPLWQYQAAFQSVLDAFENSSYGNIWVTPKVACTPIGLIVNNPPPNAADEWWAEWIIWPAGVGEAAGGSVEQVTTQQPLQSPWLPTLTSISATSGSPDSRLTT